jgi:quinohemoprotein ethanol dehydrogenase
MDYVNEGRILTFALDGEPEIPKPAARPKAEPYDKPPPRTGSPELVAAGRNLFVIHCARCHSIGIPAISPDLSRSKSLASLDALEAIVLKGALQPGGMPRFSDVLSAGDASALQSYLIDESWQAYEDQENSGASSRH